MPDNLATTCLVPLDSDRHDVATRRSTVKPSANDHSLRDRAAIAGIGWTEYSKNSGVSTLELALRAITAALRDCGLGPADVDGLITHGVGDAAPAASVGAALGV